MTLTNELSDVTEKKMASVKWAEDVTSEDADDAVDARTQDDTPEIPILAAISQLDAKLVDAQLKLGVDINARFGVKSRSLLHELVISFFAQLHFPEVSYDDAKARFVGILELLVNNGVDLNGLDSRRWTALHQAASYPHSHDVILALVASGIEPNVEDSTQQTALHKAVVKASVDEVQALIDGGANLHVLDCVGNSPLHLAVKRKFHTDIVQALLSAGCSPDIRDNVTMTLRGSTPLHAAVKVGHLENIKALLTASANVDLVDGAGQSVAHLAAANDITGKVLSILCKYGVGLNEQDSLTNETPLHKAVQRGMFENIRFMASHGGVNPNIADYRGETVLHKAAGLKNLQIWTFLLRMGGDVWVRNADKDTPIDKALKARNPSAVTLMKYHLTSEC